MSDSTERTILTIHPGALGDVLLARPAMQALQRAHPRHALGLLAGGEVARLLKASGEAAETFPLESEALASLLAGPASVRHALRDWLNRCDLAVAWMDDQEGCLEATLRAFGIRSVIVCSPNRAGRTVHQTSRYVETVREVVKAVETPRMIALPHPYRQAGRERLASLGHGGNRPVVAVHPGSGSPHKCSDPSLLAAVADALCADGCGVFLIGGPADDPILVRASEACRTSPLIVQGLDQVSAAGVLANADLFVGHDSGLTHLAAVLGRPTVAIFGPTDADRWAPVGPHVRIVRGSSCRCRGWNEVEICREKPCLRPDLEELLNTCRDLLQVRCDCVA
jgi:ADP-heptose:LPS heptosyltransferase